MINLFFLLSFVGLTAGQESANFLKQETKLPVNLEKKMKLAKIPFIELSTGFAITQFRLNTPTAISIGENNRYPSIYFDGSMWFFGYLGLSASYIRGVIVARGVNSNPTINNSVIMGPSFLNLMIKGRFLFKYLSWSSYVAMRLGHYQHSFDIEIPSKYIHKKSSTGWNIGLEYKMSLGSMYSFLIYSDFIKLDSFKDDSLIASAQNGIGYRIGANFSFTVSENKMNKTLITIGYIFTTHIAELKSDTFDSRTVLGVNYFEETYDNLYLSFSTWF